jgi:hypothetical protein
MSNNMPVVVLLALCVATAAAGEFKTFDYSVFGDISQKMAAATAKFDRLILRAKVGVPDNSVAAKDLLFTVARAAGPLTLRPAADGTLSLPVDPALLKENPKVTVNVPKDTKLALTLELQFRLSDPRTFPYSEIDAALTQANALAVEQAGVMSWFAPEAKGARIRCGADCAATVADGRSPIRADKNGDVVIPADAKMRTANPSIALSHPATAAWPML